MERAIAAEQRFEHPEGDEFWHGVGDAYGHRAAAVCTRAAQHARELETARKDLIGVAIGDTAEFGGHEPPALALEQSALQLLLEQLDLSADGLRGEVQGRCGLGHAALAHHGPEIEQVGVVEMAHEGLGGRGARTSVDSAR